MENIFVFKGTTLKLQLQQGLPLRKLNNNYWNKDCFNNHHILIILLSLQG